MDPERGPHDWLSDPIFALLDHFDAWLLAISIPHILHTPLGQEVQVAGFLVGEELRISSSQLSAMNCFLRQSLHRDDLKAKRKALDRKPIAS